MGAQGRERPPTAADRTAVWGRELFEELLPVQPEPRVPVLLACDDEIVRVVGERMGYDGAEAAARFAEDVKIAFGIGLQAGFRSVVRADFDNQPRPRPLPEFFPVLCLWVLAASRMGTDAKYPTSEYYGWLRGLLAFPGDDYVESFEFIGPLFERVASWLDDDLEGARGQLILPAEPHPRWVGIAISQTVFRARDRQVLSRFFSERLGGSLDGFDPLRRLQRWSGRGQLTAQALRLLENEEFADRVRAAIHAAFRSWDGAELVETGHGVGRFWPAFLRLLVYPQPQLQIGAGNTKPLNFPVGDAAVVLEPGRELAFPWELLAPAQALALELGDPGAAGGALRVPRLGDTIIFERSEDGLLRVDRATAAKVWLLTGDAELQRQLERHRFNAGDTLPAGWALFYDVPVEELPQVERAVASRVQAPLRLEGGLPLGHPRYLSGFGPLIAAGDLETEDRLSVTINDEPHGSIASGERLELPSETGRYDLVVGDSDFRTSYDVEDHGQPIELALCHDLGQARALRSGARPASAGDGDGDGVTVRGATVSAPYRGCLPILTRVACNVETIDGSGELMLHCHEPTPSWFAEVGFDKHGRWEVFCDNPVWLLQSTGPTGRPWARLLADSKLARLSEDAARRVRELAPTVSVTGRGLERTLVHERWRELVDLAGAASGGPAEQSVASE